ncbi:MAG TPA: ATP-binding protein [Gammaproteobacteria bacterium]|nr:ATP-binding protein [Gammaproteobacteria bacterium]
MSLRFRLNLLVSLLSLAILSLGTVLVIHNARRAVFDEIQSAANLTMQLLDVAATEADGAAQSAARARLLARLEGLEGIRHLRIVLAEGGSQTPLAGVEPDPDRAAPGWFTRLVEPPLMESRLPVLGAAHDVPGGAEIILRTDPADEIDEAWNDARGVLGLVLAFAVIANAVFFVAVGHWLRPLERVASALEGIEHGNYSARLPSFQLPELTVLSRQFNHMAEALERSRDENRELAQRSLAIQESERRHLAQELHDELGQSISAIKAVAVSIGKRRNDHDDEVNRAAAKIADVATHVYAAVNGLIRRLRPVRLDEFGLVAALEELVDGWNERQPDSFCHFSSKGRFDDLGEGVEINVYRIVQESLTNAAKHSSASEVRISLEREDRPSAGSLRLDICDDGAGFEPERARLGLGLLGMRERTDALGGKLDLQAAPGKGVAIHIDVPLPARRPAT